MTTPFLTAHQRAQLETIGRDYAQGHLAWQEAVRLRDRVRAGETVARPTLPNRAALMPDRTTAILHTLDAQPATAEDVARRVGMAPATARDHLVRLYRNGLITRERLPQKPGKGAQPFAYWRAA